MPGITDDVTDKSFELRRGAAPQLDAVWGTTSARVKTALESRRVHQTSHRKNSSRAPWRKQKIVTRTWHARHRRARKMQLSKDVMMHDMLTVARFPKCY